MQQVRAMEMPEEGEAHLLQPRRIYVIGQALLFSAKWPQNNHPPTNELY